MDFTIVIDLSSFLWGSGAAIVTLAALGFICVFFG